MSWKCPICNTENDDSLGRCDCDYEFDIYREEREKQFNAMTTTELVDKFKERDITKYNNDSFNIIESIIRKRGAADQIEAIKALNAEATTEFRPAIWNPNATANWSLIFSPAFGSYLQMLNWRALGEPEKAASSRKWFYVSIGMLAVYGLMGAFMADTNVAEGASWVLSVIFLSVWYFSSGRKQCKYVKEKFGSNYARESWGKALLVGIAAYIGCLIAASLLPHCCCNCRPCHCRRKASLKKRLRAKD